MQEAGLRRCTRLSVLLLAAVLAACSPAADASEEAARSSASSTPAVSPAATPQPTATSRPTNTYPVAGRVGPFPSQPAGVPWPTEEWTEAAWPAEVDRAAVDAATETAFAGGGNERVRAVD